MTVGSVLTLPFLMLAMLAGALGVFLIAVVAGLARLVLAGVGFPLRLAGIRRGVPAT